MSKNHNVMLNRRNTKWFLVDGWLCFTPLSPIFLLYSYIIDVSVIAVGNWSALKIHWDVTGQWQSVSHNVESSTPCDKRDSNSYLKWWYALIAQVFVNPIDIPSRPLRLGEYNEWSVNTAKYLISLYQPW